MGEADERPLDQVPQRVLKHEPDAPHQLIQLGAPVGIPVTLLQAQPFVCISKAALNSSLYGIDPSILEKLLNLGQREKQAE